MSSRSRAPEAEGNDVSMRELARFVAEVKALAGHLDQVGARLPAPEAAPFLHRQLERALLHVRRAIATQLPGISDKMSQELERSEAGLMDRVRKTLKRRRDLPREDIAKDIEASLEEGLQGNTWTIPIPDLLGFLATGRKTGVLWVHDTQETFLLQLVDGTLIHATSDGNPDRMRMGEVLVHLGKLGAQDLDEFLGTLSDDAGFLGAELLKAGAITGSDLTEALTFQIQDMFRRLLASDSAVFRFQEGVRLMSRADVALNVQSVLLDVLREADEMNKALSLFDEGGEDGGGLFGLDEGALASDEGPAGWGAEGVAADGGADGDASDAETDGAPDGSEDADEGDERRAEVA